MRTRLLRSLACVALLSLLPGCDWVTRASEDATGGNGNADSGPIREGRWAGGIAIDGAGRIVVFESAATDLLAGGNAPGLFLRDLSTGTIERISGGRTPDITPDGRYVAYADHAYGLSEVWVLDRATGATTLVSVGPSGQPSSGYALNPSISADGRYVAFQSQTTNLVPGFGGQDVYVRDLVTGTTEVVSVDSDGGQADDESVTPSISDDGRYVAFSSRAGDLVEGATATGYFENYVRDRVVGVTTKVSLDDDGHPLDLVGLAPDISGDGRSVVFVAEGAVMVRDLVRGTTEAVSVPSGGGAPVQGLVPSISRDGRIVVFLAGTDTLIPDDTNGRPDVVAHDRVRGTTIRLTATALGQQTPGTAGDSDDRLVEPVVSGDGQFAAFATEQALVPEDTNGFRDVYVRVAWRPTVDRITPADVAPGSTATLVVDGDGFRSGSQADFRLDGPGGVTVLGVDVVSLNRLEVDVRVDAAAASGPRTLVVWNPSPDPGGDAAALGFCDDCLLVG